MGELAGEEGAAEIGHVAALDAGIRLRPDGRDDDDAAVTRLRVGISRGGDSGILCWRLLLKLLARRAVTAPSPGAAKATPVALHVLA
jgi:hypothetical protein